LTISIMIITIRPSIPRYLQAYFWWTRCLSPF